MLNNTEFVDREAGTFASQGLYEPERKDSQPSAGSFVGQYYQPEGKDSQPGSFVGQFYQEPSLAADNFLVGAGEGEVIVEYEEGDGVGEEPAELTDNI